MKKLFLCVMLGALAVGCSSSEKQTYSSNPNYQTGAAASGSLSTTTSSSARKKYQNNQIIDQEFENFAVQNDGFDRVPSYEEQINSSSYIQSTTSRSKKKPARAVQKTVVNGQGQILSPTAKAPVTDQEVILAK